MEKPSKAYSVRQQIHTEGRLGGAEIHVQQLKQAGFHVHQNETILHTHLPRSNIKGMFSKKIHVCTVHNVYDKNVKWRGRLSMLPLAKLAWRRADKVIAITDHVRRWLIGCGIPQEKIQLIHYGVWIPELTTPRFGPQPIIGCVGRLEPRKGQDTLIRAMPHILQSFPDCRLLLIGRDPHNYGSYLKKLAYDLGVSKNVNFVGELSHTRTLDFLREISVYAQISRQEGLGLSVLEAMAHGKPVVLSNIPPFREIVPSWLPLARVGSAEHVARLVISMISNPSDLGDRLQEHVKVNLSIEKMIISYRRLYENLK